MAENPIERLVDAGVAEWDRTQHMIDATLGTVAPVGKRLLTRREKLLRSLTTPARQWAPAQQQFVLKEMLRIQDGGRP